MYLTYRYRNIYVSEMGPEISGKQKRTPKPKRKFILGHLVLLVSQHLVLFVPCIYIVMQDGVLGGWLGGNWNLERLEHNWNSKKCWTRVIFILNNLYRYSNQPRAVWPSLAAPGVSLYGKARGLEKKEGIRRIVFLSVPSMRSDAKF